MKLWDKKTLIALLIAAIALYIGYTTIAGNRTSPSSIQPTPSPAQSSEKVNIKASFTIITGGITRSFKAEKYHNLSPDVYIDASDPNIVHVTKKGITWDDFFKTLPMKLTKDCLTTGDGETFCDGKNGSLKFFLNEIEDKVLLEKQIREEDKVLIKFTPGNMLQ